LHLELVVVFRALEMCFGTDIVFWKLAAERTEERLKWHQELVTYAQQ